MFSICGVDNASYSCCDVMVGSIIHPSWDRNERRMAYLSSVQCVDWVGNLSLQLFVF